MKKIKSKDKLKILNSKCYVFLSLIFLVILLSIPIFTTTSRYVISRVSEHYFDSKEFYFSSNILNGETYNLYNWDGTDGYQISIDTRNDKDLLNWTKADISYEIITNCTSSVGTVSCSSSGSNILMYNSSLITSGSNIITLSIGDNEFASGDTVTIEVTARSTSPYEKELHATFIVEVNKSEVSYVVNDETGRNFLDLVVTNHSANKSITVNIDATKLSIDSTNYFVKTGEKYSSMIDDEAIINRLVFQTLKDNVYSIRFYKNNPDDNYSLNTDVINIS